jgi:hypothetical protein
MRGVHGLGFRSTVHVPLDIRMLLHEIAYANLITDSLGADDVESLKKNWDGIEPSLISLIYTITGGVSWSELADPFFHMSPRPWHGFLYAMFVIATLFGLMNVLVGIFVTKSEDTMHIDKDGVLGRALAKRRGDISFLEEIFKEMDSNESGTITADDFVRALSKPRTQAYFHHLELHYKDARAFFHQLDTNGDNLVDLQEFTDGCLRLQGPAKPQEVHEILQTIKIIAAQLDSLRGVPPASVAAPA